MNGLKEMYYYIFIICVVIFILSVIMRAFFEKKEDTKEYLQKNQECFCMIVLFSTLCLVFNISMLANLNIFFISAAVVLLLVDLFCFGYYIICLKTVISCNKVEKSWTTVPYIQTYEKRKRLIHTLKEFNHSDQSYGSRMLTILLPVVTLTYMVTIFGVYEVFFANISDLHFVFFDFFIPSILIFLLTTLFLVIFVPIILKGNNLQIFGSFVTSVILLSYIQYAFLNQNEIIGITSPNWENYILRGIVDLFISLIVCIVVMYFQFKKGKAMYKWVLRVSGLILIMQLAPLPVMLLQAPSNAYVQDDFEFPELSGEEQFAISSDENVIVFVMDTFSNNNMRDLLANYPDYYEDLSDFTFFDNVGTVAFYTPFSMPYLLTGHDYDFTIDLRESNKRAWTSEHADYIYTALHDSGYEVKLYTDESEYSGGAANMQGKIDNITMIKDMYQTKELPTYLVLLKLSVCRYSNYAFKETFWVDSAAELNNYTKSLKDKDLGARIDYDGKVNTAEIAKIVYKNTEFYDKLIQEGLSDNKASKQIIFYHIHGMHEPYDTVGVSETDSEEMNAALGCMRIFQEYIDQMKKLGVYENSTIILTADHGRHELLQSNPVFLIKPRNYSSDRLVVNHAPGVLQTDLFPTIFEAEGIDYEKEELSLFKIDENMIRERIVRDFVYDSMTPPVNKVEGIGESWYNAYYEYHYTGDVSEVEMDEDRSKLRTIYNYWW